MLAELRVGSFENAGRVSLVTDRRYDVAIVGGGIMGASSAYHLAKAGKSVVLIERGEIGRDQSSRNWGFVRQQGRHPAELPLMLESNRLWPSLATELGEDIEWTPGGNLALASDTAKLDQYVRWSAIADEYGLDTRILNQDEVKTDFPQLSGTFAGAMLTPSDGHANPLKVTRAFARAAAREGASIITSEPVEKVEASSGVVNGVTTSRRSIRADRVVVAAGEFTSRLLRGLGISLPQRVVRATVASTPPVRPIISAGVWSDGVSFRQASDGRLIFAAGTRVDYDITMQALRDVTHFLPNYLKNRAMFRFHIGRPFFVDLWASIPGTSRHRHPFDVDSTVDPAPSHRRLRSALSSLMHLLPEVGDLSIDKSWAGNIDATPDAIPVIDAVDSPHGLIVATGFSGHGFALGPITGKVVTDLVIDGATPFDLRPLRLSRFAERDLAPATSVF